MGGGAATVGGRAGGERAGGRARQAEGEGERGVALHQGHSTMSFLTMRYALPPAVACHLLLSPSARPRPQRLLQATPASPSRGRTLRVPLGV